MTTGWMGWRGEGGVVESERMKQGIGGAGRLLQVKYLI